MGLAVRDLEAVEADARRAGLGAGLGLARAEHGAIKSDLNRSWQRRSAKTSLANSAKNYENAVLLWKQPCWAKSK